MIKRTIPIRTTIPIMIPIVGKRVNICNIPSLAFPTTNRLALSTGSIVSLNLCNAKAKAEPIIATRPKAITAVFRKFKPACALLFNLVELFIFFF